MSDTSHCPYGPSLRHTLTEPLDSLRQLGRRALLALLGIAVGCASMVALLNIGHNAAADAISTFKDMGSDMLVASFSAAESGGQRRAPVTLDTLALTRALPGIHYAAPLILTSTDARLNGRNFSTIVVGTSAELALAMELRMTQGRFLTRYDRQSTYAVLGAKAAIELGASLRSRIQIGGYLFEVVGVLQERGQNPLIPVPVDEAILLPVEGIRRLVPSPEIGTVVARARDGATLPQQAAALRNYLSSLAPGREVTVQIPQQLLEGMARQSRTFTWLLAGLGGIALLVGGVGVMNVMVMNVSERRREIGVRMALGARPQDIGRQFLLEAVVLAVAGALAGSVFGLAAAWLFVKLSGWAFSLSPLSLPLGIISSLLVGLFFGLYPALTAARLEPVRALRDD
ncbi:MULTISPECIES: ABC transporter permease [unclassified Brenneria]|uniref:ABC transporter permease n=1 Tax=unclassified Brenneria TaxID=2634434 RepID=UPI001557311C|nr:ABC transporter permease [Brenneria sp. hezel4-2-4]MEE3652069.1 ABC transporter permease [Brenneria sp. HEZEL_4_2_4]NPD02030.1 ABC transporter permease [Brenneria sp. hezel4-2-4]